MRVWEGVAVIWQPVQLEREMTIRARAQVEEHLSTSHHNDSQSPVEGKRAITLPPLSSSAKLLTIKAIIAETNTNKSF